jgi:hypothetical protein
VRRRKSKRDYDFAERLKDAKRGVACSAKIGGTTLGRHARGGTMNGVREDIIYFRMTMKRLRLRMILYVDETKSVICKRGSDDAPGSYQFTSLISNKIIRPQTHADASNAIFIIVSEHFEPILTACAENHQKRRSTCRYHLSRNPAGDATSPPNQESMDCLAR